MNKNEPKSSKVHDHIKNNATRKKSTHKTRVGFVQKMRRKPIFRSRNVNSSMRYVYNSSRIICSGCYLKYLTFFSYNFPYSEYEGVIQRDNCTKNKLHNDIEKTLFLDYVDPSKTIKATYSQGDVVVFGQNAGQQCVAMSLCALIYHNMKEIGNPNELKQIVHIGSKLYSSLSQLSRQSFLLLADLPSMPIVLGEDYQLEYSESDTGNVHGEPTIEGYQYCMGLERAF